jgi:S-adenosylmethionine:diacylglycerol 3-amino-3-carboxypropyl transferase
MSKLTNPRKIFLKKKINIKIINRTILKLLDFNNSRLLKKELNKDEFSKKMILKTGTIIAKDNISKKIQKKTKV